MNAVSPTPSIALHVQDPAHTLLDANTLVTAGVEARVVTLDDAQNWQHLPRNAAFIVLEITPRTLGLLSRLVRLRRSEADWTPLIACCENSDDIRTALDIGADDFILNHDLVTVESRLSVVVRQKLRNDKLDGILNCTFDGIVSIDETGTMLTFNKAAQEMFGFSSSEMIGRNVSVLMDDEHGQRHDHYLRRYVETGEQHIIGRGRELRGRTKSGETFPLFLQVASLRSGKEWLFVGILKNLSVDAQAKALKHEIMHDPLTGLFNRMQVAATLPVWIGRHGEARAWPFALLFIDLNGFKAINDTYGHDAGDAVLKAVGARLTHNVTGHDIVARMSGDEFVVLLDGIDNHVDAQAVARRLAERISVAIGYGGQSVKVGASIGVAVFPDDGLTASELLLRADSSMYEQKRHGARGRSGVSMPPAGA